MAYTRWNESGYYIFGGYDYVDFDGKAVSDDAVDVFINRLFDEERNGGADFWERFYHGKRIIENFQKGFRLKKLTLHSPDLEAQAAVIAALAGEIWREHYTPIIGPEQVEYMLAKFQSAERIYTDIRKNNHIYFTARETNKNEMIGYCGVTPENGCLLLSKIYVHRDYQGKGIACGFMDEAVSLCGAEYGYSKIRLTVNKHNVNAIAAYKKMGYETVDSVKKDIGGGFYMDDYVMELEICTPYPQN